MMNDEKLSKLLSDSSGLKEDTIDMISRNTEILSDEQKNRIMDIIRNKESLGSDAKDKNIKVIEYRKNRSSIIRITAVAAACLCVAVLAGKLKKSDINNDDIPAVSVVTTAVSAESPVTVSSPETTAENNIAVKVTDPSVTSVSAVPVTVTGTGTFSDLPVVSESNTTEVSVTEKPAVTEPEKTESRFMDLKDIYLSEGSGPYHHDMSYLLSEGFNSEQVRLLEESFVLFRLEDYIDGILYNAGKPLELYEPSTGRTGMSYSSFKEFLGLFFAEGGTYQGVLPENYFTVSDEDGELVMLFVTRNMQPNYTPETEIKESDDSHILFDLISSQSFSSDILPQKYKDEYSDITEAVRAWENDIESHRNSELIRAEISEDGELTCWYSVECEMVNTSEGWRFKKFVDWRS